MSIYIGTGCVLLHACATSFFYKVSNMECSRTHICQSADPKKYQTMIEKVQAFTKQLGIGPIPLLAAKDKDLKRMLNLFFGGIVGFGDKSGIHFDTEQVDNMSPAQIEYKLASATVYIKNKLYHKILIGTTITMLVSTVVLPLLFTSPVTYAVTLLAIHLAAVGVFRTIANRTAHKEVMKLCSQQVVAAAIADAPFGKWIGLIV